MPPERHPLRCGRRGKLYDKSDFVQPLIDCITETHKFIARLRDWRLAARTIRRATRDAAPRRSRGALCVSCGTTDASKLRVDAEWYLVCDCGAVNGRSSFGDDYVEARDPARRRGEASRGKAMPCMSAREQKAKGIGAAAHISDRATLPLPGDLPPRVESKLQSVIEHVNRLAAKMAPVEPEVVAEIRRTADRVVRVSHAHLGCCVKAACTLNIVDKPPAVIGAKCFIYTIEKMSAGAGIRGVSKQTLTNLHQRVRTSREFSLRDNSVQHEGLTAAIATVDEDGFERERPCAQVRQNKRPREEGPAAKVALQRMSSGGLESSARGSKLTKVRNAIADSDFGFDANVQKQAIRMLVSCIDIAGAVKSGRLAPRGFGDAKMACSLMRAVSSRYFGGAGCRVPCTADVEAVAAALAQMLPEDVADDDDLF